ncbi:MAG: hypothetical protein JOZ39_00130 [Chloroflexi bacterium]|nr:hypothetical protein [Chloroflexota bacterium]
MPAHDQTVSGGAALADERRQFVEAALAAVNAARLQELLVASVDIPSPTGHERPLAEFLADHLARHGLDAKCQVIDGQQANTVGRIRGDGSGLDLLLYAPLDAGFSGDPAEDIPWLGDDIRADFKPSSLVQDGLVIGAGAENPKGYAACVIAAAEAVATAGVPLKGDLIVDLGA